MHCPPPGKSGWCLTNECTIFHSVYLEWSCEKFYKDIFDHGSGGWKAESSCSMWPKLKKRKQKDLSQPKSSFGMQVGDPVCITKSLRGAVLSAPHWLPLISVWALLQGGLTDCLNCGKSLPRRQGSPLTDSGFSPSFSQMTPMGNFQFLGVSWADGWGRGLRISWECHSSCQDGSTPTVLTSVWVSTLCFRYFLWAMELIV